MRLNHEIKHGDVTGGFNSSALERSMEHVRNAFLLSITQLQDGGDPKPYLITKIALALIGNYQIRDNIINEFENSLDELEDGRYSPAGINECISVWAAISEYMGMFGSDKRLTVLGESTDHVESHFTEEDDEGGELTIGEPKGDRDDIIDVDDDDNGYNGTYIADYKRKTEEEKQREKDDTEEFEDYEPDMKEIDEDDLDEDTDYEDLDALDDDMNEIIEFSDDEDDEVRL